MKNNLFFDGKHCDSKLQPLEPHLSWAVHLETVLNCVTIFITYNFYGPPTKGSPRLT
jgi:hypothetical protein